MATLDSYLILVIYINKIFTLSKDTLMKIYHDLQNQNMDINGIELFDKLSLLSEIIDNGTSPLHVLQKTIGNNALRLCSHY